ncbi:UDP-N-acetylmuramoyl-L-alanyl-D-glutamate--2,6-diaminopimelate ligase [Desulfococcaceae bacterium HSG9]|nr:UDP-N-acetylmuramoyl-L-alanyl-D-glutamate--2,6-diaminopimelate ligase [Desulfococcaceae bacterium HSG9]
MKLSTLVQAVTPDNPTNGLRGHDDGTPAHDPEILSLHYRAQDVKPGGLFVAISGLKADGHDYINIAIQKGALAVVVQKPIVKDDATIIRVADTRHALARLAARFYGNPSETTVVIGVTGTNGKTTTTYLIESILAQAGRRVGVIGTINYRFGAKTFANPTTTPESAELQKILSQMKGNGVTHVIMEVSSHAIAMHRADGCNFDIGVFTNLTQDHLDFHGDMEAYWACKREMFTKLMVQGSKRQNVTAVLNCDNRYGRELAATLPYRVISFGSGHFSDRPLNDVLASTIHFDLAGIRGCISTPSGDIKIQSVLVGRYNLENILAAIVVGIALQIPIKKIQTGIEKITCIPGRLEPIINHKKRFVFVDYAHTPDALKNVLTALNALVQGRLICVFGCGGNRDKEKRPQMGSIAFELSDLAIITSDNPRSENPRVIIEQIRYGIKKKSAYEYKTHEDVLNFNKKGFIIEEDRNTAIHIAVKASAPGDTILIAGKGHETYQIIGDQTLPFDDRERARAALLTLRQS